MLLAWSMMEIPGEGMKDMKHTEEVRSHWEGVLGSKQEQEERVGQEAERDEQGIKRE